ncbi:MAG: histidine phosphatase family protein [Desulfobacteraceae bacterium]|nr:histidine phosphatase family protein [Desulfobacteraceae bacterium]MBC2757411.1 histidine phosphatase family protein [Desulfobacteraceae bacterium]MBC2763815.1 histidine phosphatase family protein [ANME-2 cluster archaeon]
MSIIYLIRHAQASFGQANYDRLSDLGQCQAKILADHFQALDLEFDAIYSGGQLRHEQTLAAYLKKFSKPENAMPPVHKTDAFNEYNSENILKTLIPEMIRDDAAFETDVTMMLADKRSFQTVYEKVMRKWINSENPANNLGTWKTYSNRVRTGLDEIMASAGAGKKIAVFTSGGPISVCVQKALSLSDGNTLQLTWQIMNTSITRLKYSGNQMALFGFNDVTHLEIAKDEQLLTYR